MLYKPVFRLWHGKANLIWLFYLSSEPFTVFHLILLIKASYVGITANEFVEV